MPGAMPQNHAQTLREQKPMSRRAKLIFGGSSLLIIIAVVVAIVLTDHNTVQKGCVHTYLPGVIGAQTYDECGQDAIHTCLTVKANERQFGTVGVLIIEKACRKGQLAVG